MPLRLLLQRREDFDGPPGSHLDIAASDDRVVLSQELEALGATTVATFERWIVMADSAGTEFCVTGRDPHTAT